VPDYGDETDDDLKQHRRNEDRFGEILPAFHNTPVGFWLDSA
jgi:hypothetical protein